MKRMFLACTLACGALAAGAASISLTPVAPTPVDTVVLRVEGAATCAFIPANPVGMADGRVIRVRYVDGSAVTCLVPNPQPTVTLGRLPAGTYRVELVLEASAQSGAAAATQLAVAYPPANVLAPPDDYSGHYVTDVAGEGVFVEQQGNTAFITYLFRGPDNGPEWAVMPDARWEAASNGTTRFFGAMWRFAAQATPGTGVLATQTGFGSFSPAGLQFDRARFSAQAPQSVERELVRLRF